MITKYRTGGYYGDKLIDRIGITRETEKMVFITDPNFYGGKEQRYRKHSEHEQYWSTWAEAYNYLITKATKSINNTENNLAKQQKILQDILNLRR